MLLHLGLKKDECEVLPADRSSYSHLINVSTRKSEPSVEIVIAPQSLVRQMRAFVVCSRAIASACGCPKGLSFATEITACCGFTLSKNSIVDEVFDPWCATFKTSARRSLSD